MEWNKIYFILFSLYGALALILSDKPGLESTALHVAWVYFIGFIVLSILEICFTKTKYGGQNNGRN